MYVFPTLSSIKHVGFNTSLCLLPSGDHKQKFYWGHKEILLPVYKNMADAMKKHQEVDVLISFASLRSAFDSTMEAMQYPQVDNETGVVFKDVPFSEFLQFSACIVCIFADSHHCYYS